MAGGGSSRRTVAGERVRAAGPPPGARAQRRLAIVIPLTLLVIFMILSSMFGSMKWAGLVLATVAMAPVGGVVALLATRTNFSVSSMLGFVALMGVARSFQSAALPEGMAPVDLVTASVAAKAGRAGFGRASALAPLRSRL